MQKAICTEKRSKNKEARACINITITKVQDNMERREPTSKFVKVRCPKCKNEQIIFGKCATTVKCLVCEKVLAKPTGGKSTIKVRILEVLD